MWAGSGPARSSNVARSYAAKLHALWLCEPGVRHADRMAPSLRAAFDDARISSSVFRCSCFEVLDLPAALPGAEPIKALRSSLEVEFASLRASCCFLYSSIDTCLGGMPSSMKISRASTTSCF